MGGNGTSRRNRRNGAAEKRPFRPSMGYGQICSSVLCEPAHRRNQDEQILSKFCIDDGANRAVACYLAGFREAYAYIGVVREEINHKWEWRGW